MNKSKVLNKLFLIIVSVQTILMGILFIVQVLRIYFVNKSFSREICGMYIMQLLPVIIIWLLVIITSYVYFYKFGSFKKNVSKVTNIVKLKNLERICPNYKNEELKDEYILLQNLSKKRVIAKVINIIILVICSIMGLCYLLNVNHFKSDGDLTKQAIQMSIHLIPWCVISFLSMIACTLYEEYNAKFSVSVIKEIIKTEGKVVREVVINKKKQYAINITRVSLISIAIALIIVGVINGEATDVLQKAINICTECIGLG